MLANEYRPSEVSGASASGRFRPAHCWCYSGGSPGVAGLNTAALAKRADATAKESLVFRLKGKLPGRKAQRLGTTGKARNADRLFRSLDRASINRAFCRRLTCINGVATCVLGFLWVNRDCLLTHENSHFSAGHRLPRRTWKQSSILVWC